MMQEKPVIRYPALTGLTMLIFSAARLSRRSLLYRNCFTKMAMQSQAEGGMIPAFKSPAGDICPDTGVSSGILSGHEFIVAQSHSPGGKLAG
jgi:hypothetical protein